MHPLTRDYPAVLLAEREAPTERMPANTGAAAICRF